MPFHFCADELVALLSVLACLPGLRALLARWRTRRAPHTDCHHTH